MAHQEIFKVKWNEFQNNLYSSMDQLLEDEHFVDVTLACDGRTFVAHKIILAFCSPYFQRILQDNSHKHPIVILTGVNSDTLLELLRFMYHGSVDVPVGNLNEFLRIAEILQIKGISENSSSKEPDPPRQSPKRKLDDIPPSIHVSSASKRSKPLPSSSHQRTDHQPLVTELRKDSVTCTPITRRGVVKEEEEEEERNNVEDEEEEQDIEYIETSQGSHGSKEDFSAMPPDALEVKQEDLPQEMFVSEHQQDEMPPEMLHSEWSREGKPLIPCPICGKTFTRKDNMKQHINNYHSSKPYEDWEECYVCGKRLKTRHFLLSHLVHRHSIYQSGPRGPLLETQKPNRHL